jgi:DegV family protein with EDD domain
MPVAVITDTCASIPSQYVSDLSLKVVPYFIHREGKTLRDMVDVFPDEFYSWLPTVKDLPTTANPGPGDYLDAFEQALAEGYDQVISIHLTSKGSGAYQAGLIAKEMAAARLPELEVEVVDTLQVSMVHGWASIEAARAAKQGEDLREVARVARYVSDVGCMIQTADTLRYLYLGGRIGFAKHLVGSLLNIKPIISMNHDGIIVAVGQERSISQAISRIVELMAELGDVSRPIKVGITHNAAPDRANALLEQIEQAYSVEEVAISQQSPALGVHTGPGMVGVSFYPTEA